ncbi:ankyrin [Raccoonpox virus]|uniref:Ankyrin repeat-containing protein n=1 Tax=Raccoon poxvirus TaxID=10256 RepID=A0A0G3FZV8_RACVI|nr:Ankyrin repeat-containing protein [Raccoonpox virus]AKJ93649.1 Ankyrin repeat-containing protein [Raccoonpox virus]AOP31280.1 ankyrin [Raccoonpox virus]
MGNNERYSKILYNSCKTFDIDACSAQSLIERGANPLYQYDDKTPLKVYVTKENVNIRTDIVVSLLSTVNYKNINDFNIFDYIHYDNIDIDLLRLLIRKGLEIKGCKNNTNIVEKYAMTKNPNIDVFKILFEQGIPMCSNMRYGYKIVIDRTSIDDDDYDYVTDYDVKIGKTALYYYIITRPCNGISLDVLNCLLSYEKDIRYYTYRSHTTLYYYIGRSDIKREIFDALFDDHYPVDERMYILTRYLRKQYRNKNYKFDNYIIDRLLDDFDHHNILNLCNMLRDNSALISIILKKYKYCIQDLLDEYILKKVYLNVVKNLVSEGAVLYRFDHINKYFLKLGDKDNRVVEYILKNGVDIIYPDDTYTNKINVMPLFSNIFLYNELLILRILKLCMPYIDINRLDCDGNSILYYCVNSGSVNIVKLLVDNGADINIVTNHGNTCIAMCIVMVRRCIPKISKKYINILEIIFRKLPTIECIKKSIEYLKNNGSYIFDESVKKLCIKYFTLIDYSYIFEAYRVYPSSIDYINECKNELDDMHRTKLHNVDMFTFMYKLNKHVKKRYVRHPVFTEWSKKQYKIYTETIDDINDFIKRSEEIYDLIEEVSVDNNLLSILPLEIKDLIFSYAFL